MNTDSGYASIDRRFLAMLIDGLVLFIPCLIGSHVIPVLGGLVVLFFYSPVLECSTLRGTLGKYWMGIQVVDLQGSQISFQSAVVRSIVKFFSSTLLFLGHFVAFFTGKKQALHDILADTVVVYGRDEQSVSTAWVDSVKRIFQIKSSEHRDSLSKLERLQTLREKGTITEEEFQIQKQKILKN